MTQGLYKILANDLIAQDLYKMVLEGDTSSLTTPDQFINIKIDGFFLRRPFSVCDYDDNTITVIYKVVGEGTEAMSHLSPGGYLDILAGLGNGFDTSKSGDTPLLLGGGAGAAPMYNLAKKLVAEGKKPIAVLGFNTAEDVYYEKEFADLGFGVYVATVDGRHGTRGFVTDVMKQENLKYTYFYACGPALMYKAIEETAQTSGQYSLEERMGCGFGACMGCSCQTTKGNKRICKDGPVFEREEIIW